MNPWSSYTAGIELRPYQEASIKCFSKVLKEKKQNSFYLLAPPGSGKTILALIMAEKIAAPALVLSPNATIEQQWINSIKNNYVCLDNTLQAFERSILADYTPKSYPLALISTTYQRISVQNESKEAHKNVVKLYENLIISGVKTIILDECHHLSRKWGQAVMQLINKLDNPFIIALTATPLSYKKKSSHNKIQKTKLIEKNDSLKKILMEPDHEISLPSVVRSNDLVPFADLCLLVSPASEEEELIKGSLAKFKELFETMRSSTKERFSLDTFMDMLELEPKNIKGEEYEDLHSFLIDDPDLVSAWCRLRNDSKQAPPAILPYLPEFYEKSTLSDHLLLASQYTARYLLLENIDSELAKRAIPILKNWGYKVSKASIKKYAGKISRQIGFSRRKLEASLEILRCEIMSMGDELRVLVLTDYEFPPKNRASISCVDVMDLFTSDTEIDELDPIMITGNSLLIDDDLFEKFYVHFRKFSKRRNYQLDIFREKERGYWRINGMGKDWNTKTKVELITDMLERGVNRCVIGTRSLLGEGWNCPSLNTLIDLSVVTSGVSVNQIRGRTFRKDPNNDLKVANNWDVLCLSYEHSDFERLKKKHSQLFGVTDDGQIELGVGHIHACFDRISPEKISLNFESINTMMKTRAQDRSGTRDKWRIGSDYNDVKHNVLSFNAPASPVQEEAKSKKNDKAKKNSSITIVPLQAEQQQQNIIYTLVASSFGLLGICALAVLFDPIFFVFCPIPIVSAYYVSVFISARIKEKPLDAEIYSIAKIIHLTIKPGSIDETVEISRRDDGTIRINWPSCTTDESDRLSTALAEMLGPITNGRYLIHEELKLYKQYKILFKAKSIHKCYNVPRVLSSKQQSATLLENWKSLRNKNTTLHHIRSQKGQKLQKEFLFKRPFDGELSLRTIWK
jgi:superfamily II DNA or RNA helicase